MCSRDASFQMSRSSRAVELGWEKTAGREGWIHPWDVETKLAWLSMEKRTQHKSVPRLSWHRDGIFGEKQEGPCLLSEAGWGHFSWCALGSHICQQQDYEGVHGKGRSRVRKAQRLHSKWTWAGSVGGEPASHFLCINRPTYCVVPSQADCFPPEPAHERKNVVCSGSLGSYLPEFWVGRWARLQANFSRNPLYSWTYPFFLFLSRTPGCRALAADSARPPGRESKSLVKDFLREMLTSSEF